MKTILRRLNRRNVPSIMVLVACLLLVRCNDFLDVIPRDKVSSDIVFTSYESATTVLGGVYDHMTYSAEGFMIKAQSLGIHNFILAADMMGQDIIPKNFSGQFQGDDYSFSTRTMEKDRPSFFWFYCYTHINVLNDLLSHMSKMQGTTSEKKQVEGEARALRAYHYLLLVQWFQQTYLLNPEAPGVPLYLEPTIDPKNRESMKAVYEAITADLQWAVENLPSGRRKDSKYVVCKDMVKGLLSRVYMETGDYEKAAVLAKELAEAYPLMSNDEYKQGFNNVSVSECIWGLPASAKNTNANYSLPTVWSHPRKNKRWSMEFVFLNSDFVELFAEGDVRKELIRLNPKTEETGKYPERKYISFKIMDPDENDKLPDVLLMRSSEMLLIAAECAARLKKDTEAQQLLFKLQQTRYPAAVKTTATGQALIDEIWTERRKELYGEGFALLDLKRFRKPLVRKGLHTIKRNDAEGILYPADSKMFTLQIPEGEIQTNNIEQNP